MKIEINHRFNGSVLFAIETDSWRLAVEAAIKSSTDLSYADLSSADLSSTDLSSADLSYADLSSADLSYADLSSTDLSYANLSYANLSYANLSSANLNKTVLDPANTPNCIIDGFKAVPKQKGWVYGYRTRATSAAGLTLQDDRIYGTEVFSTSDTECHPGWYLWPSLAESKNYTQGPGPYVQVKARIIDIHKAGSKWRSRAIWVIGGIE
jgi:hypothetical protein